MEIVADILLGAGALSAGFYCFVLHRRLNEFRNAESGIGPAVATLSAQVDELTRSVGAARKVAENSKSSLELLTDRAEGVAQKLELMIASMHDIPSVDDGSLDDTSEPDPVFSSRMPKTVGAQK